MDSLSHAPLQNVTVSVKGGLRAVLTDGEGKFRISVDRMIKKLLFTSTGYKPASITITDHPEQRVTILLSKAYITLQDVVIKGKRGKYRNKNNPAVDLIRKVIANKAKNGPGALPYTSYQQYEKVRLLLDKPPRLIVDNKLLK